MYAYKGVLQTQLPGFYRSAQKKPPIACPQKRYGQSFPGGYGAAIPKHVRIACTTIVCSRIAIHTGNSDGTWEIGRGAYEIT